MLFCRSKIWSDVANSLGWPVAAAAGLVHRYTSGGEGCVLSCLGKTPIQTLFKIFSLTLHDWIVGHLLYTFTNMPSSPHWASTYSNKYNSNTDSVTVGCHYMTIQLFDSLLQFSQRLWLCSSRCVTTVFTAVFWIKLELLCSCGVLVIKLFLIHVKLNIFWGSGVRGTTARSMFVT